MNLYRDRKKPAITGVDQSLRSTRSQDPAWSVLDALDLHVAIVSKDGVILHINKAWEDFAARNPLVDGSTPSHVGVGTNYLSVCRTAVGSSAECAYTAYLGIKDVLTGKKKYFVLEYPCHSPLEQRWFVMKVTPLKGARPRQVAIVHTNITALKQAEFEAHSKTEELAEALENLEDFAGKLKSTLRLGQSIRTTRWHVGSNKQADSQKVGAGDKERFTLLSKREREVLVALTRGERVADIAKHLSLSAKSISTYRSRVLEKLQARTTADLVTFMTRIGAL